MLFLSENRFEIVDGDIENFKSRVIKVDSWKDYVNNYIENKTVLYKGTMGNTFGVNFPSESKVSNLKYDEFELSCDVTEGETITKRVVQIIDSSTRLQVKPIKNVVDL